MKSAEPSKADEASKTTGQEPAVKSTSRRHWLRRIFLEQLPLESETTVFIFVSLADFFMTYWMLWSGEFREHNPIARWFLEGWGLTKGLLLYKLALTTTVCLIAQIVYPKRPAVARALLNFGSLAVLGVVLYSVVLYVKHAP
jgi:hypothetical protein